MPEKVSRLFIAKSKRDLSANLSFADVRENAKQANQELMKLIPKESDVPNGSVTE